MIKRSIIQFVLIFYAVIVIYPLFWVASSSLRHTADINDNPWGVPVAPRWENYASAWNGDQSSGEAGLATAFINSSVVTIISLAFILLFGSMAAYVLARYIFVGNGLVYNIFLFGMMFPVFLGIIPLYLLLNQMGSSLESIRNTLIGSAGSSWALVGSLHGLIIIYVAYSLSFTIFILTAFFKTLPGELAEAGAMDGCSQWGIFWKIMLPLAKPGLITAGIFNAIGLWNEYPLALVLTQENTRTLPIAIADLAQKQHYQTDQGALFAGIVIVIVPTLIGYLLFQRRITAGLTAGAIKG